jgi:hypothetical protein
MRRVMHRKVLFVPFRSHVRFADLTDHLLGLIEHFEKALGAAQARAAGRADGTPPPPGSGLHSVESVLKFIGEEAVRFAQRPCIVALSAQTPAGAGAGAGAGSAAAAAARGKSPVPAADAKAVEAALSAVTTPTKFTYDEQGTNTTVRMRAWGRVFAFT